MSELYPTTIGADPEFFIRHKKTGVVTPAFDLFGGTKRHPSPIKGLPSSFTYHEDGAALEFNIPATVSSVDFSNCIRESLVQLIRICESHPEGPFVLEKSCQLSLTGPYLRHTGAENIGCVADHYAYGTGLPQNKREPFTPEDFGAQRFAGGHIHVGYNTSLGVPEHVAASFMDVVLALGCVGVDKQGDRRKFYGLPGLYRPKPYGIEYRTLSNFWLFKDRTEVAEMATCVMSLAKMLSHPPATEELQNIHMRMPWNDVRECIIREDAKMADMLITWCSSLSTDLLVYTASETRR